MRDFEKEREGIMRRETLRERREAQRCWPWEEGEKKKKKKKDIEERKGKRLEKREGERFKERWGRPTLGTKGSSVFGQGLNPGWARVASKRRRRESYGRRYFG